MNVLTVEGSSITMFQLKMRCDILVGPKEI